MLIANLVERTRQFIRDFPALNRLVETQGGFESLDHQIELAIQLAISDFNNTTPVNVCFTVHDFPCEYLLIQGSVLNLLRSVGLLEGRNQISFNSGKAGIDLSGQFRSVLQWYPNFYQDYEMKKKNLKMQINADSCYGSSPSIYGFLSGSTIRRY